MEPYWSILVVGTAQTRLIRGIEQPFFFSFDHVPESTEKKKKQGDRNMIKDVFYFLRTKIQRTYAPRVGRLARWGGWRDGAAGAVG
jgi:hypothetical protein